MKSALYYFQIHSTDLLEYKRKIFYIKNSRKVNRIWLYEFYKRWMSFPFNPFQRFHALFLYWIHGIFCVSKVTHFNWDIFQNGISQALSHSSEISDLFMWTSTLYEIEWVLEVSFWCLLLTNIDICLFLWSLNLSHWRITYFRPNKLWYMYCIFKI